MNQRPIRLNEFDTQSGLFQRTRAPHAKRANPFSFGGGGSGLSPEAGNTVSQVLEFDYMGAAQYEFGMAARCLAFMYEYRDVLESTEHNGFFFLCHTTHTTDAHTLWGKLVKSSTKGSRTSRDYQAGKTEVLPFESLCLDNEVVNGWFDFNNGFFVSRTNEQRDAVRKLFMEFGD